MSRLKVSLFLSLFIVPLLVGPASARNHGKQSGFLGVVVKDTDLNNNQGALISEIIDDSPAEKAGLQDGDVIIEFNGQPLGDSGDLTKAVGQTLPDQKVPVVILRDGKKKTLDVKLDERQESKLFTWNSDEDGEGPGNTWVHQFPGLNEDRGFMGVDLDDLNDQLGEYFKVKGGQGALITSVNEDSPAEKAGLKAGDVIIRIADQDVASADDVHEALRDTKPGQDVKIKVVRKGKKKTLDLTLGKVPDDLNFNTIRLFSDSGNFHGHHPKMFRHGLTPPAMDQDQLKEMREELEQMKTELKEMQKELKNK